MYKFKIPSDPPKIAKSVRFPVDLIDEIEEIICGKECTFSAFIIAAVRNVVERMKEEN